MYKCVEKIGAYNLSSGYSCEMIFSECCWIFSVIYVMWKGIAWWKHWHLLYGTAYSLKASSSPPWMQWIFLKHLLKYGTDDDEEWATLNAGMKNIPHCDKLSCFFKFLKKQWNVILCCVLMHFIGPFDVKFFWLSSVETHLVDDLMSVCNILCPFVPMLWQMSLAGLKSIKKNCSFWFW